MKLSVVIPIYNSERYLGKCLKSIQNQLYTDFEVLMINDGSTDNSERIAAQYFTQDSRFKYFEIPNSGVSTARNYGINNATGEYITFVDSDDFLDFNHFQLFMDEIINYDIVVGGYKIVDNKIEFRSHFRKSKLNRHELVKGILKDLSIFSFPWNKIFRRNIIEDQKIRFRTDINFGEDLIFDIEYAINIEKACVLNCESYNYVQHKDSVSARINKKKLIKRMTDIDAMIYTVSLLEKDYPDEKDFLKERIAREGIRYWYLAVKYQLPQERVDEYRSKISPYIKWFFKKRKKDYKTLKLLLKCFVYITAAAISKCLRKNNLYNFYS